MTRNYLKAMRKMVDKMEAAEILTTGWCPLNCKYCYIPKSEVMRELHNEIVTDLEQGKYIEKLREIYGDELKTLGFWGTEPTLTLDLIQPLLPQLTRVFPKLNEMSFSTSMIVFEPIARFIEALQGYGIKLKIQVSLDGPSFITDRNRFRGAAKKVPKNFFALVSVIQDQKTEVEFHWKATLTTENIIEMNGDPSKIDEYHQYFENLNERFDEVNRSNNISLLKGSYTPTLMVPGNYTSEDGRDFAHFLRNLRHKGHRSTYSFRLERLLEFWDELGTKKSMFTCSAGDSNSGIGNRFHICHRSFYLDESRYVDSVLQQGDKNWDTSHLKAGTIDLLRKYYIVDMGQDAELTRLRYVMRNYHDFWRLQIGHIRSMMIELALAGQVDHQYSEDSELSTLFGLFVNTGLSCPIENMLNTGSIHLTPLSLLKMFGNGAFQELIYDIPRRK
ncbi:hypothetical protein ES703_44838 [subsurface metagenome]